MTFLIADTFTRSIARLPDEAQRSVKRVAFDLQTNPAQRSLRLHRIARATDPGFWSVRVNRDVRIVVHRSGPEVVFCYADHHDAAYAWAEHRKLERHAAEGTVELVELVERTREIAPPCERERGPGSEATVPRPVPTEVAAAPETLAGDVAVDERRRFRTHRRAVAPLAAPARGHASAPGGIAPLAQLLRLAQHRGSPTAPPVEAGCPAAGGGQGGAACAASPSRRGPPLHVKILALALLAAPGPMLASLAVFGAAARSPAFALVPGVVGLLLLVAGGLAASRMVASATRTALGAALILRDAVRVGRLEVRAEPAQVDPELRPLIGSMNEMVDGFAIPFAKATSALTGISQGDLAEPLTERFSGEFERQRDAINAMVRFVLLRAEDIRLLIGGAAIGGEPRGARRDARRRASNGVPPADGRGR